MTKQDPKKLLLGLAMVALGFFAVINGVLSLTDNLSRLIAPRGVILIETVDTNELRALGLSGRESIADDRGMMFVFDRSTTNNCFWMKDMKFSIDMIWLNEAKQVITVVEDVSPGVEGQGPVHCEVQIVCPYKVPQQDHQVPHIGEHGLYLAVEVHESPVLVI